MKPHDPELGEVDRSDLVKGYRYKKGEYVIFTDEDFERIQIDSSRAIVIEKFVDGQDVDPIYFEWPYYVAPDGAAAEETFRVLHWAMRKVQKVALSRVVLLKPRTSARAFLPRQGFLMMTLRAANEVRDPAEIFADIKDEQPEEEMLALAENLIEQKSGKFDPREFRNCYQEAVIETVKAKAKGQEPVLAEVQEGGKVINLMDALRRSLDEAKPPAERKPRKVADKKVKPLVGDAEKRRQAS